MIRMSGSFEFFSSGESVVHRHRVVVTNLWQT